MGLRAAKPQTMPEARVHASTAKATWAGFGVSKGWLLEFLDPHKSRGGTECGVRTYPLRRGHLESPDIVRAYLRRKGLVMLDSRWAGGRKRIVAQRPPDLLAVLGGDAADRGPSAVTILGGGGGGAGGCGAVIHANLSVRFAVLRAQDGILRDARRDRVDALGVRAALGERHVVGRRRVICCRTESLSSLVGASGLRDDLCRYNSQINTDTNGLRRAREQKVRQRNTFPVPSC